MNYLRYTAHRRRWRTGWRMCVRWMNKLTVVLHRHCGNGRICIGIIPPHSLIFKFMSTYITDRLTHDLSWFGPQGLTACTNNNGSKRNWNYWKLFMTRGKKRLVFILYLHEPKKKSHTFLSLSLQPMNLVGDHENRVVNGHEIFLLTRVRFMVTYIKLRCDIIIMIISVLKIEIIRKWHLICIQFELFALKW